MSRGTLVLLAVAGAALIYGATNLIIYIADTNRARKVNDEARSLLNTAAPVVTEAPQEELPPETPLATPVAVTVTKDPDSTLEPVVTMAPRAQEQTGTAELLSEYTTLYSRNHDLGGWLRVRALLPTVDIPVVRGKNDYYMTHSFNGAESVEGTAFIDELNSIWPRDEHLFIYAHNLKSGEMFGKLNRLTSLETLRRNPFVDFDTLYEKLVWVPVAAYVCSINEGYEDYFNFFETRYRNETDFDNYIARAKELSYVKLNVDVRYGDRLLTLVTCHDDEHLQRFCVLYRQMRPGETETELRSKYFRPGAPAG